MDKITINYEYYKDLLKKEDLLTKLEEWLKERYDICEKHLNEMTHDREFYLTAMYVNADRKDTLNKIQELKEEYK